MNESSEFCGNILSKLSDVFRLLSISDDFNENLDEALHIVAEMLQSPVAAIYKKYYTSQDDFRLELQGMWHGSLWERFAKGLPIELESDVLAAKQWRALESHEIIFTPEFFNSHQISEKPIACVPLFLEKCLFGFMVVADTDEVHIAKYRKVLENICHGFEACLSRLNTEKKITGFLDFVPYPIMTVDSNGVITAWSKTSEEMTGWKRADVLGKGNYTQGLAYYGVRRPTIPDLILNPDSKWETTYPEFKRDGDKVYSLSYCPAVIGGGAYLRTKTTLLYDLNNRVCGDIHMVEDMTRELEMEENLNQSESMYRAITDFAGVGIMVLTEESIIYHNEYFADLLGTSNESVSFDILEEWTSAEDRDRVLSHIRELFQNPDRIARFEFSAQGEDGLLYYKAYAQVMQYEGAPAIHFIVDDITNQRELEQKARLNELRMYHEDRLNALGMMAAGIAHELNQPLNHIRMTADSMLLGKEKEWNFTPEDIDNGLGMISRQVVRMSQVVQNIRNFSRKEKHQKIANIYINEAVENVFGMIGRQLEAHGIMVHEQLDSRSPCLRMSQYRLEQVILNLIVNARQALDKCARKDKNIWVTTGMRGERLYIEVMDDAMGISDDVKSKIFEPFFTTKEVDEGTGLGLSIVKSIVEEFDGRIDVSNNNLGGATFVISGITAYSNEA